jgi:hypothetical protein
MITLGEKWQQILADQPETGMDYQVCTISLADGRTLEDIVIESCRLVQTDEFSSEDEITDIEVVK